MSSPFRSVEDLLSCLLLSFLFLKGEKETGQKIRYGKKLVSDFNKAKHFIFIVLILRWFFFFLYLLRPDFSYSLSPMSFCGNRRCIKKISNNKVCHSKHTSGTFFDLLNFAFIPLYGIFFRMKKWKVSLNFCWVIFLSRLKLSAVMKS